jgi:uncharacterized protein (DUF58 family)
MLRRLLFANFKLVYKLGQKMRQRFTPAGMMILLTMPIAGIFGFDTRSTLSFQIFSITIILLITAMFFSMLFRGKYSIERKLPDYGTVGTPLYYSCVISNQNKKPGKGLVLIDDLNNPFPSLEEFIHSKDPLDKIRNRVDRFIGYPRLINTIRTLRGASITPVAIDYIAEKSATEENIKLTPLRRGYIYFEKLRLAQSDPLGLFQAQKTYRNKEKLLILPKIYKTPVLNTHGKRTYQHGGINNASSTGDSQEFISLRDYRAGDPIRSIHWKSYAKTNHPVVKEYDDEFFIRYGLILDTWLDNKAEDLFEDAVSIAASFMAAQKEQDALLDLMFIGNNTYRFTSGRGLGGTDNIMEVLACIKPVYESNIQSMESMLKNYMHECSALICVLLDLDESRQQLLKTLSNFNVPIKVLVITDSDETRVKDIPFLTDINVIHHDRLQQDLDALQ